MVEFFDSKFIELPLSITQAPTRNYSTMVHRCVQERRAGPWVIQIIRNGHLGIDFRVSAKSTSALSEPPAAQMLVRKGLLLNNSQYLLSVRDVVLESAPVHL
jgi:hypothetical protein